MKKGLLGGQRSARRLESTRGGPAMLYVGLDLSRKRLDFHAAGEDGEPVAVGAAPPDADGLRHLVRRLGDAEVVAVIETMNGSRFVHDQLELLGWDVRVADARKARALAPLACKTDRIDALGARRARASRSRPRGLAARPDSARGARAGALPLASRPPPLVVEEPDPRDLDRVRASLSGQRSVRCRRPATARPLGAAGSVAGDARDEPLPRRRARRGDPGVRPRAEAPGS